MWSALILAVIVGTWNGEWFPSGRAEHRANPEVEAATIREAGKMLRAGIDAFDPEGKEGVILCLNEVRGPRVAGELAKATGLTNLQVAVVTGYRRRDRFDYQQDVILTTLPVVTTSWSRWKSAKAETPPRGYAQADLVFAPAVTARVYAVHLKSNYGATGKPAVAAANRAKRTRAVEQLVEQERVKRGHPPRPLVICGDFNTDKWREEFKDERVFTILEEAGYTNLVAALPPAERATHPNKRWGDSVLDYIFLRGLKSEGLPKILPNDALSDHRAVFSRVKIW